MGLSNDVMVLKYRKAMAWRERREYYKAIKLLSGLVQKCPGETLFLWELGYTFLDASMPQSAIPYFQRVLEMDSDSFPAWGGLGQAYMETGDWDKAEHAFVERLRIRESANHYVFLAHVLIAKAEYEGAIASCEKALSLKPTQEEALLHLGIAFRCINQYPKANQAFLKAVDSKADYALAYSELGYTALLQGDEALAEQYLTTSHALDDRLPITQLYLYLLYSRTKRDDAAQEAMANLRNL